MNQSRKAALAIVAAMATWGTLAPFVRNILFEAYRYTTVSVATLSYYFAPVIVTALCPLLFHVSGQQASILSYTDPLVAVVVSVLVLGEPLGALQTLGGALILGFTLWNELTGSHGELEPIGQD